MLPISSGSQLLLKLCVVDSERVCEREFEDKACTHVRRYCTYIYGCISVAERDTVWIDLLAPPPNGGKLRCKGPSKPPTNCQIATISLNTALRPWVLGRLSKLKLREMGREGKGEDEWEHMQHMHITRHNLSECMNPCLEGSFKTFLFQTETVVQLQGHHRNTKHTHSHTLLHTHALC